MKKLSSRVAFLVYVGVMLGGYVWATFLTTAPYVTLAEFLTIGASAYWGKRLLQKHSAFNGSGKTPGTTAANETVGCD